MVNKPEYKQHVSETFTVKDEQGFNNSVQNIIATPTSDVPLDAGNYGKKTVVRSFFFQLPPRPKGVALPDSKILLNQHRSRIIAFLWKDELELIEEPKLYWRKDLPHGSLRKTMTFHKIPFVILAVCQAKKGSIIHPETIKINEKIK